MSDEKGTGKYRKGTTQMLAVKLSAGEINVKVRLIEHRMVFGRSEWKVAPVSGNGTVWIQEKSFRYGVAWMSPSEQTKGRIEGSGGEQPPIEPDDVKQEPRSFASRKPRL